MIVTIFTGMIMAIGAAIAGIFGAAGAGFGVFVSLMDLLGLVDI